MLRTITLRALCAAMLLSGSSCILEESLDKHKASEDLTQNAIEASADTDVAPSEEDLKCKEDNDCQIIQKGCCFQEKALAVSRMHSSELQQKIINACRKLKSDYWEEQKAALAKNKISWLDKKIDLCNAREGTSNWLSTTFTGCKKDSAKPELKNFVKDFQDPAERSKKFQEAEESWLQKPGKCILINNFGTPL